MLGLAAKRDTMSELNGLPGGTDDWPYCDQER
jgi:hypothetical protein